MTRQAMARATEQANRVTAKSFDASRVLADLMAVEPDIRREFYRPMMGTAEFGHVLREAKREHGTAYHLWHDDAVGFTEDVLHETTWSKQRDVLVAIGRSKKTAVPSCVGVGKTHIAARATVWRSLVYPIGESLTITTATRFRQVQRQMWPHIRQLVKSTNLPLVCDQTQMRGYTKSGVLTDVAYGFSAPPHDEAAMQGIHHARLFLVIDEGGGISRVIGRATRSILTGDDSRMLVIGNPPTDDEQSWFEELCTKDPEVEVVRISAFDAPWNTGEVTQRCLQHRDGPRHPLSKHITDQAWVEGTIRDYGEDSAYVAAKVYARFPKGGPSRVIPADWVEQCVESPEPDAMVTVKVTDPDTGEVSDKVVHYHVLSDLIPTERDAWKVAEGAWVRLGVDVAADGGDELVISRAVGDLVTVRHTSSGQTNTNSVDVAGKILHEIRMAEELAEVLESPAQVEVKIDAIGVGWGIAGTLEAWGTEGMHGAKIVKVLVSEGTYREDEPATLRPDRKRDEMWLTGRSLLSPVKASDGFMRGRLRLRIDDITQGQLASPKYGTNSQGRTVVESKKAMRARGVKSPDRAESVLLSVYEPIVSKDGPGVFRVYA